MLNAITTTKLNFITGMAVAGGEVLASFLLPVLTMKSCDQVSARQVLAAWAWGRWGRWVNYYPLKAKKQRREDKRRGRWMDGWVDGWIVNCFWK